jgi:hypothetical protein
VVLVGEFKVGRGCVQAFMMSSSIIEYEAFSRSSRSRSDCEYSSRHEGGIVDVVVRLCRNYEA